MIHCTSTITEIFIFFIIYKIVTLNFINTFIFQIKVPRNVSHVDLRQVCQTQFHSELGLITIRADVKGPLVTVTICSG